MATYLINFKKQFAPAIEEGKKRRTIRQHRKDGKRILPGDWLKLYTGLRTRGARLLRTVKAERVMSVRLLLSERELVIDGRKLDTAEKIEFATADGFGSFFEMVSFFRDQYGGGDFEGYCVEWGA